ncbi:glycosyltransferase family A protein [Hansschlegelia zhihuaiae]|nr:glycosyltransferase family A protein [Hansschlegelia zhihuaiae]
MAIRLTLGSRETRLPLYATEVATALAQFEAGANGAAFALPAAASIRLTQFGNRASSKQRQQAYALAFRERGRLAVTVRRDAGSYPPECFLCFQVYDDGRRFLTQFWIPLAENEARQEVELPRAASVACFSVHLAGVGVCGDLTVEIAPQSPLAEDRIGFVYPLRSPEDLLALLADRRTDQLSLRQVVMDHPELVTAAVARWFFDRRYHEIFQLLDAARPWREERRLERVWPQLLFFAARGLANLNATQSAIAALEELHALPNWRSLLDAKNVQASLILHGQLLIRNGRADEGVAALELARLNEPTHWQPYYLLANNLDERSAGLRDAYYRAAETLLGRPHPKLTVALVENDLRQGRWSEALSKALAGLAALKQGHDVWLAAANLHLEIGDLASWRRFVGMYFEQYGLSAPRFPLDQEGDARFAPIAESSGAPSIGGEGRVAVVMTAFNSERTLKHAAKSVLAQTYGDVILVIVDDCSSDGTLEIARRLAAADARVRIMGSDVNSGTYTCKNIAISQVDADFYTFHDSDDWMHPERIARHLDAMRRGAACSTSLWYRMSADGRIAQRHAGGYQHANPASIFVRKDVVETVGYFDTVRTGADTEYLWRIRNRCGQAETVELRLPLAIGLHHEASLTQSGAAAFDRYRYSQVRLEYWESWVRWHIDTLASNPADLHMAFPPEERRFWAPEPITPDGGRNQ